MVIDSGVFCRGIGDNVIREIKYKLTFGRLALNNNYVLT